MHASPTYSPDCIIHVLITLVWALTWAGIVAAHTCKFIVATNWNGVIRRVIRAPTPKKCGPLNVYVTARRKQLSLGIEIDDLNQPVVFALAADSHIDLDVFHLAVCCSTCVGLDDSVHLDNLINDLILQACEVIWTPSQNTSQTNCAKGCDSDCSFHGGFQRYN